MNSAWYFGRAEHFFSVARTYRGRSERAAQIYQEQGIIWADTAMRLLNWERRQRRKRIRAMVDRWIQRRNQITCQD